MAFSLKKLLTGAVAQVNPFDNGKTWDTVQRNVAPTPPPAATLPAPGQAPANFARAETAPKRNLWERGWDQVNFADNGRTWKNARPKVKDPFQEAQKLNVQDFTGNNTKVNAQILPDKVRGFDGTPEGFETSQAQLAKDVAKLSKGNKQKYVQNAMTLAKQGNKAAIETLTVLGRMGELDEDATGVSATNPLINAARAAGKGIVSGGAAVAEGFNKTPGLNAITPIFTAGDPEGRKAAEEAIAWGKKKGRENELTNPTGVGGVIRQAGNMAPVLAASAINPTAGISVGYGQGTGMTYDALKQQGASENKARMGGVAAGIPSGFLAYLGAKGVLNPTKLASGAANKVSPGFGAAVTTKLVSATATVPGKVATNAVLRTPLELATSAGQQVATNAAMNVGGVKTGLTENVGEAAKQGLITSQIMGAGFDVAPAITRGVTTKLVSGAKRVPEVASRALDTPQTAELRVTNNRLQQQFDNTTDPRQRKIISTEIARNRQEINSIKQGGYVRLPGGDDTDAAIQARLNERPANLRKIEQSKVDMPDSERLALANGDTGQAGLPTDKATRDSLLAQFRAKAKSKITPLNEGGYFRTPGGGKDFSDGSLIDNTPEGAARLPQQQELPIVGPKLGKTGSSKETIPQTKKSGFAEGVARSGEVSAELQGKVKAASPEYTPVKNQDQLAAAEKFVKKGYKKATADVQERLQKKTGTINDQDVADSIEVIKQLDSKGGPENLRQATEVVERLSEHLTKAGQTVQAAALLSNRTPQGLLYGAIKTLKGAGVEITPKLQGKLDAALKEVKATKPGTYEGDYARFKFIETVNKNTPSSALNKGVQLWKAGLLTAPSTTAGNITANTLEQVVKRGYVDVVQTGLDQVFSVFTGKRSKSLTARGLASGAKEGALKGVSYFKTGYDPRNPNQKFDVREIHYSDSPAGKAAEAYTQGVFRLMGAQDQPFYYASLRNSLADQAITAAKNQGLKGPARTEFIKKFVTSPDSKTMQLADTEARYDVFQNKTALGERATKIKSGSALGDFLIPFSGVPSSIATRIIERTPIGAAHEIVKQVRSGKFNQRRMTQALANGTTGMVMAGAGAALVGAGEMTLGYPQDEKERKLWELEGKQAYSVKVGDKWVSLNYFQPAGVLLAAGGAYKQAVDEGKSPTEALSVAAANTGKAFTEQTFLKGVSGALNAVNDPKRSAAKFLEQTAGSVIPNFMRSIARSTDPKKRETNGVIDAIVGGIPKARQTLLEDRDTFGQGLDRQSSGINSFINPAKPSDVKPGDATTKEIRRLFDAKLGVMPTTIDKSTFGKDNKISDKEANELNAQIQPKIKAAWDEIINDSRYAELSDEDKQKTLRDASETIYGLEKKKYESGKQINAYSPTLTPEEAEKKQKLSTKQKDLAEGTGVDFLTTDDSEADDTPAARYKKAQEAYDKKAPKMSDIEKTKADKSLKVLKVKADYDDDTVELQSMTKADLWDYVSKSPNGKDQLAKVVALDDAMVAAGIYEKSKYRDKYGNITVGPKKTSSSGGKRKGKGKGGKKGKASKYGNYKLYGLASKASGAGTDKALASILKNARLS